VVNNKRFYGFTIIDLPTSKCEYEYKWKFTSEKIGHRDEQQEWMNDLSGRPHVSCFNNQLLQVNDSYDLLNITQKSLKTLYKLEKKYKLGESIFTPPPITGVFIMNFELHYYDDCNGIYREIIHDICENIGYYDLLNMQQQESVIRMVLNKHFMNDITGCIMSFINPFQIIMS
jgi:hypothetical protein